MQSCRSKSCRKGHAMSLCDPHIKKAVRIVSVKCCQAGTVFHCRRDRYQSVIFFCQIQHNLGKHICTGILSTFGNRLSCLDIKRTCSMETGRVFFCREIPFPLFRQYMDKHRSFYPFCLGKRTAQCLQVMPVHRS